MITLQELVEAVAEMRHWQREYFRSRGMGALAQARRAEGTVDGMLATLTSGQRNLFDDPD